MEKFKRNAYVALRVLVTVTLVLLAGALALKDAEAKGLGIPGVNEGEGHHIVSAIEISVDGLRDKVLFIYSDGLVITFEQQDVDWKVQVVLDAVKAEGGGNEMELQTTCGVNK